MAPRKTRHCPVCNQVFKRAHNVTNHMNTAHEHYVKKLICPLCDTFLSTIPNMRIHLKRVHSKKHRLKNGRIDGQRIDHIWVPAASLTNGRYHGQYFDDQSSNYSDSECLPLSLLAQQTANEGKINNEC